MDTTNASLPNAPAHASFDDESSTDDDAPPDIPRSYGSSPSSLHDGADHQQNGHALGGFLSSHVPDGVHRLTRVFSLFGDSFNRKLFPRSYSRDRSARFVAIPQGEDDPEIGSFTKSGACMDSLKGYLFASWLNVLLIFVPLGYLSYYFEFSPIWTFTLNVIAVVPLSAVLTEATEKIASDAGDTLGALLNISMGNFVELILFIVALLHNHIRIVQASILGSILVNLLLILGSALLASSFCNNDATFNSAETQLLSCILFVSVFVFLMPTAFDYTFDRTPGSHKAIIQMSRISALMVLLIYVLYFVHELRTRQRGASALEAAMVETEECRINPMELPEVARAMSADPSQYPRHIRFADEGSVLTDEDGIPRAPSTIELSRVESANSEPLPHDGNDSENESLSRGRNAGTGVMAHRPSSYDPLIRTHGHSRSFSMGSNRDMYSRDSSNSRLRQVPGRAGLTTLQMMRDNRANLESVARHQGPERERTMCDRFVTIGMLFLSSMLMSASAEFLVSTIDEVTHNGHLSEAVIGLIILPIVGNMAEYITVVTVAVKEKLDLAIAVAVGSAIQIALCVTPLTIIAGWLLRKDFPLTFNIFELSTLLGGVLLVNLLILSDGSGNLRAIGLKGALMCSCYFIIGLGSYLSPEPSSH